MNTRILLFLVLTASAATPLSVAAEQEKGSALYQQHCVSCHGSEIYTREDRKVNSLPGLQRQVQRCETALGLRWFDEDIGDVAAYLNESFYHFKP
jgi:cytochrome c peroxidase